MRYDGGSIQNSMNWIDTYKQSIDSTIDRFFREHYHANATENEKTLQEAVLYAVHFGNPSRIHGILSMVAYEEVLGLTADPILPVLIGLEFIHTSYLLHGDVAWIHNIYHFGENSPLQKYGTPMMVIVGDILMELGMECLTHGNNMKIIREVLSSTWDVGVMRGIARDMLTDRETISEGEYITMYDEELARFIVASLLVWAYMAGDSPDLLRDQFRQFGTFLARLYQVGMDLSLYEKGKNGQWIISRDRWVVDFLGYDKTKDLYENLNLELMKMTTNFQNSKFHDIVDFFRERKFDRI